MLKQAEDEESLMRERENSPSLASLFILFNVGGGREERATQLNISILKEEGRRRGQKHLLSIFN